MKKIKYFLEFIILNILFIIFKILGHKKSIFISEKIFCIIGPIFRDKKIIIKNLKQALPNISNKDINRIIHNMWGYYGKIFAEYPFIKNFRKNDTNIKIEGKEILEEIKNNNEAVIFISAHFDNFELMAMSLEKSGINVTAIYRPLNNIYMNKIMENIRIKYICKNQVKKGVKGIRSLVSQFKNGSSIALMIDQRVSEGIKSKFFNKEAYTTTIPAQFVKKFNCRVVAIYIERLNNEKFKVKVFKPIKFNKSISTASITEHLNYCIEKMIIKKPEQWIWSHNRWK